MDKNVLKYGASRVGSAAKTLFLLLYHLIKRCELPVTFGSSSRFRHHPAPTGEPSRVRPRRDGTALSRDM